MTACQKLQMPPTCKAVLMALANNANDQGYCWPSIACICEDTCYKKDAVIDAIEHLEVMGIVTANRSNGRHTTYTLSPSNFTPVAFVSKREKRRINQSGKPTSRANRPVGQTDSNPSGKPTDQSGKPTVPVGQTDTNRQEPSITQNNEPSDVSAMFDVFWQQYPKKVAKAEAQKSFAKLKPDRLVLQAMVDALDWQRDTDGWRKNAGQFVPNPTTWLNQRRWEDDKPEVMQVPRDFSLEDHIQQIYANQGDSDEWREKLLG